MDAWLRFRKNRLALIGLALVLMLVLAATLAPWLALHDPTRQSLIEKRARPGAKYLLGADEFGRDILSRVIYGSRVALLVGVVSVLIALAGGLLLGTAGAFNRGLVPPPGLPAGGDLPALSRPLPGPAPPALPGPRR